MALVWLAVLCGPVPVSAQGPSGADHSVKSPYAGTYACEVRQNTDCGKCPGYPGKPEGLSIEVASQDDGAYRVCMVLRGERDCRRVAVSDQGKAGYKDRGGDRRSGWESKVHFSFKGDSVVGTEQGSIHGACACTYFSRFSCTR